MTCCSPSPRGPVYSPSAHHSDALSDPISRDDHTDKGQMRSVWDARRRGDSSQQPQLPTWNEGADEEITKIRSMKMLESLLGRI